jgi:hypothetical protein
MKSTKKQNLIQYTSLLNKPTPPTAEAIEKAQFKDKTYSWNGR